MRVSESGCEQAKLTSLTRVFSAKSPSSPAQLGQASRPVACSFQCIWNFSPSQLLDGFLRLEPVAATDIEKP